VTNLDASIIRYPQPLCDTVCLRIILLVHVERMCFPLVGLLADSFVSFLLVLNALPDVFLVMLSLLVGNRGGGNTRHVCSEQLK
jgi:hypothetical protein